jgi:putative glycosyltransferase (TIGR04348 family)
MRVLIACPAPPGSRQGNRVTAQRWARLLRSLGHRVRIVPPDAPVAWADLLVALHARRSAAAVRRFKACHPARPAIVALTGTDVYRELDRSRVARRSLELADRLIVLQPLAIARLPRAQRGKARVLYQSVRPRAPRPATSPFFAVCVLSHLRPVKDPLRVALAARRLPAASRIRVRHAGRALAPRWAAAARAEMERNPRYRWLGERSRAQSAALLARSRLLVLSSRMEGGANVIGEAAVCGVPVLASRVDGNVGLLGARYPGYFPVGDSAALAALLARAESDARFYRSLRGHVRRIAALFNPARERHAWRRLLRDVTRGGRG